MTIGLVVAVALGSGLASTILGPRAPRPAAWIGLAGALACLVLAIALGERDVLVIGRDAFASSTGLRLIAVAWSASALLLGVVGRVVGGAALTLGPGLVAMGAGVLALSSNDAGLAFVALAAGSTAVVMAPALGAWLADRDEPPLVAIALRGIGATVGAGIVGILAAAWGASAVGPFGGGVISGVDDPAFRNGVGLVLLAMVGAVVVRTGAIPAHLWAARFMGAVTPLAVPAALVWGAAAFTLVALGWSESAAAAAGLAMDDAGRILVIVIALTSVVLGGLAAILHDDLEHILGYSIVQDAGVALLAFATLRPEVSSAARDWLVASAALKAALAGWIATGRWAFGAHRLSELHGWARRSPALAGSAVIILVGSVGIPGMAIFDARVELATSALPGLAGYVVVAAALSPLVALGRVLLAGAGRPTVEVGGAPRARLGVVIVPAGGGWTRGGLSRAGVAWGLRSVRAVASANAALAAAMSTVVLAVLGLALAITGAGGTAP